MSDKLRTAAQMALEALERYVQEDDICAGMEGNESWIATKRLGEKTITTLREALAEQPEREPLTDERIQAAWNAQADEHNQWDELGEDEKIEWAVACAKAAPPAAVDPLTDEQIQEAILPINPHGMGYFLRIARAIERAHGIGIKKGDSHGLPT